MDTTKAITHVSLCAGYGGIDLGLKRAIPSLRTIAFSEIESFACANLVSKMEAGLLDPAPIWTDLKTFPWSEFHGRVDILSGGYPCQPFSAAGKRLGAEDPRHLWPHISTGIAAMRPSACFFENVEGHISLGLPDVIEDLAGLGYRTTWGIFSASEVGAPHQRKRVFILAVANANEHGIWPRLRWEARQGLGELHSVAAELADSQCAGLEGFWADPGQSTESQLGDCGGEGCGELADTSGARWQAGRDHAVPSEGRQPHESAAHCGDQINAWPSRPGEQQFAWEPPRVVVDAKSQRAGQRSELRNEECGSRGALPWDVEQSDQAMGNAKRLRPQGRDITGCVQEVGASRTELAGDGCGELGNAAHANRWTGDSQAQAGVGPDSEWRRRLGESSQRQTQSPLGRDADGLAHRLDDAVLHVSTDNRTDELRLLGNGVCVPTVERAWRVLVGELAESESR